MIPRLIKMKLFYVVHLFKTLAPLTPLACALWSRHSCSSGLLWACVLEALARPGVRVLKRRESASRKGESFLWLPLLQLAPPLSAVPSQFLRVALRCPVLSLAGLG